LPTEIARTRAQARIEALVSEWVERGRAARALSDSLRSSEGQMNDFGPRIAQLDSLAVPPEVDPGFPSLVLSLGGLTIVALLAGLWVHRRWAGPLTALAAPQPPERAWGAPLVAQALLRREAERSSDALRADAEARRWREGLIVLPDGTGEHLDEDVRLAVTAVKDRIRDTREAMTSDLGQVRAALRSSQLVSREVGTMLRPMAGAWAEIADRARRAEIALANAAPELEARHMLERERVERFRSVARGFGLGLSQGLEAVDALTQQALRATDAAAREEAMRAHVGRGGAARPVPAPPLDEWAADLSDTSSRLRECLTAARVAERLEPLEWTDLQREALGSMRDCARALSEALDVALPVFRTLGRWVDTHEADLSASAQRLLSSDGARPPSLEADLAEVDAAVEAARTRVEAAVRRAERLIQAMGT
ncbi:MAG: hypothetical protein AAFU79_29905, partial [Myxococcota bacterium]